ncbi:MAG TPA: MFS transporter [Planctomycetes bacterium]|nr:MFS transporter [Planctomycetota bacterium]HIL35960.1 MFS transporter [Planctomycetota bacterium]
MAPWKRTFRVIWLANLITSIGMMSFLPFFPSLLEELGVQGEASVRLWAGVLFGAAPLAATLMSPIWGALGDRLGRKLMICRAMLAIAIFVGGMAFAQGPWTLLALRLGQGLFSGFIPPGITLVSVQAPADRQARVTGQLSTSLALGSMIGPLLGGWLSVVLGGHQAVFLVVGGAAFCSAVLVWFVAHEDLAAHGAQDTAPGRAVSHALSKLKSDVRSVLIRPALRATAFLVFAVQFGLGCSNPLLERLVAQLLQNDSGGRVMELLAFLPLPQGGGDSSVTLATAVAFGGMAFANLLCLSPWGRRGDRVGYQRAMGESAALSVLAIAIQASATSYGALLAGRLLLGAAVAGIGPLAFGLAAGEVEAGRRGGAFGVVFSARTAAVAVGGGIGGGVGALFGVRAAFITAGLIVTIGAGLFARSARRARES